jgi:anti-sigma B factor antagonist
VLLPGELDVQVEVEDGRTVVRVVGEIDVATVAQLESVLMATIDAGAVDIVLDFTEVPFLDSTGISIVVVAEQRLRQAEGHLTLRGLQPMPYRVLEIGGLTKILAIET